MVRHLLACLCKGNSIFSLKTIEIPTRDTNISDLIPPNTYAYFIFDTDISTDTSKILPKQILNPSPITYLGGIVYTLDEVKELVKEKHIRISITPIPGTSIKKVPQMKQIIKTSAGNWIPFFENDILITI